MNIVLISVLTVLSILGFAELIRAIVFYFLKLPGNGLYLAVMLRDEETAENRMRAVCERYSWMNISSKLVFLCDKPGVREVAERYLGENSSTKILRPEELADEIIRDSRKD